MLPCTLCQSLASFECMEQTTNHISVPFYSLESHCITDEWMQEIAEATAIPLDFIIISLMGTLSIREGFLGHPASIDDVSIKLIQFLYYYIPTFMSNRLK